MYLYKKSQGTFFFKLTIKIHLISRSDPALLEDLTFIKRGRFLLVGHQKARVVNSFYEGYYAVMCDHAIKIQAFYLLFKRE